MGVVYLAARHDGEVEQLVALKMLGAAALGSPQLLERFTRERQLLARLQHPHIASLLDGGVLADWGPFIAMEYVDGERIDAWCARHRLGLRERLALFLKVCAAVSYAHRHLVIHRDIKPANILVSEDGEPKLLDFGIAQALDHAVAAGAGDRHFRTPRYASPEQSRGEWPTVASDVYALGLLLYALMVDRPPPHGEGAQASPLPLQPSRDAEHDLPWRRQLTGDLDAIFARACAFDPAERYASVAALADDIERQRAHQPVAARGHRWSYVLARLLRRRWPAFAVGALVLAMAAGFTWRLWQAEREAVAQAAETERVASFLVSVFGASDANLNKQLRHDLTAREVLDAGAARIRSELGDDPRVRARLLEALGNAYRHMGANDVAAPMLREAAALDLSPAVNQPLAAARCLEALANTLANGGFSAKEAEQAARQTLAIRQRVAPEEGEPIANAWMVLSLALDAGGNYRDARAAAQTTYDMLAKLHAPPQRMAVALNNLGLITSHGGDAAEAVSFYERALALDKEDGDQHTAGHLVRLGNYAHAVERSGDLSRAISLGQQALALNDQLFGAGAGYAIHYETELTRMLNGAGRYDEAQHYLEHALANQLKQTGENSPEYASILFQVGNLRSALGDTEGALRAMRQVLAYRSRILQPDDLRVARAQEVTATVLIDAGRADDEAAALLDKAEASYRQHDAKPDLAYARVARARWRYQHSDRSGALALLDQVEAPDAKAEYWPRARAAALRAAIAHDGGDLDTALGKDEQAWQILKDRLGAAHPQTALYALLWSRDLREAGKLAQAQALERDAQPVFERSFPADSVWRTDLAKRSAP